MRCREKSNGGESLSFGQSMLLVIVIECWGWLFLFFAFSGMIAMR